MSSEVTILLFNAALVRDITLADAFRHAIDAFEPLGEVDTSPGTGPLQPRVFALSDTQVAKSIDNGAKAGISEESAAIAAIRQLAATIP